MALRDHWNLGTGWKVTIAASTAAVIGGAALASPGIGGGSLPPIDLDELTVITVDGTGPGTTEVVPPMTVPYDLDSTFLTAGDDTEDTVTSTTLGDDSAQSPDDDTEDSPNDTAEDPDDSADDSADESADDSGNDTADDSV